MKDRLKDILKFVLFLGIGLFFVYWFLLKLDSETKQAIWESASQANYWWVGVAILTNIVSLFFRALRWRLLYEPLGYRPSTNNIFGSMVIAYFANLAFPRLGEVLRCATLKTSENIPIDKSLGTVVTERTMDVLLFLVIVLIGVVTMFADMKEWFGADIAAKFSNWPTLVGILVGFIIAAAVSVKLYLRLRKKLATHHLGAKIDGLLVGCWTGVKSIFHLGKKGFSLFLIYSAIVYILLILGSMFTFFAFPETSHLGFKEAFVAYLFGSFAMVVTQGGIGAYPTFVQKVLTTYGISFVVGTACGWVMWTTGQVMTIAVGIIYTIYFSLKKSKNKLK